MVETTPEAIGILCVDDNPHVADALKIKLARAGGFEWKGWLADADTLVDFAQQHCPTLVIIDIDMPGRDPFEALAELVERCPESRAVMFSGHVRMELIAKAVEAGAWGYASKNDGEGELVAVLRRVVAGEFALSPEVQATLDRG